MITRLLEKFNLRDPASKDNTKPIDEDCLSCKLVGTTTFAGLSAYTLHQRTQIPKVKVFHRGVVAGLSLIFAGIAVARAAV